MRSADGSVARPAAPIVAPIALPRWQRWALYATVSLLTASGIAWLVVAWPLGESAGDAMKASARSIATGCLRVHGVFAYAVLIVAGSVLPVHLRLAWTRHRNRWSGSLLTALLLVLAGSGLWLYYGGEAGRDAISVLHWALGLVLPVWLLVHRSLGLRSRRAPA